MKSTLCDQTSAPEALRAALCPPLLCKTPALHLCLWVRHSIRKCCPGALFISSAPLLVDTNAARNISPVCFHLLPLLLQSADRRVSKQSPYASGPGRTANLRARLQILDALVNEPSYAQRVTTCPLGRSTRDPTLCDSTADEPGVVAADAKAKKRAVYKPKLFQTIHGAANHILVFLTNII